MWLWEMLPCWSWKIKFVLLFVKGQFVEFQIDFIVGREIVKGGIYKGVVTSIKEYGAFVEFNGGQQGLLHVSELSHDPVSKVSDVVSIGQVLKLMCIGLDVRGNIKLSLKATLPSPGSKTNPAGGEFVARMQQLPKVWKPVNNVPKEQEYKDGRPADIVESLSSFVIRSAAECDNVEKSARLNQDSKAEAPVDAKKLKLGTELTAKVHQIRTHGLVLIWAVVSLGCTGLRLIRKRTLSLARRSESDALVSPPKESL